MDKLSFKKSILWTVLGCCLWGSLAQAGSQEKSAELDAREIIWVTPSEKSALLGEMRGFLEATQKILEASLADDMEAIERAARAVGIKMMKATPKALHDKLPSGFTDIGPKAHMGFESIADEAVGMGDREVVLEHLAALQKTCNGCHSIYRFEVK